MRKQRAGKEKKEIFLMSGNLEEIQSLWSESKIKNLQIAVAVVVIGMNNKFVNT